MNQPDLVDLMAARDEVIERATDHAEAVTPGWGETALDMLKSYVALHPEGFTTLELRTWAAGLGFVGATNWAWGSVIVKARKLGIIAQIGARTVGDATSHLKLSPLWCAPAALERQAA